MLTPAQQCAAVRDGEATWCDAPGCEDGRIYPDPQSALWGPCGWCDGEGVVAIDAMKRVEQRQSRRAA